MKKLTVWAMFAILLVASAAFAAPAKVVADATFTSGNPATTQNDDSCDISLQPAATLLLPYFEVDLANPLGETTLFTITNTSSDAQIAHVVLWTNLSYPVIDFNIWLTGYDVQAINLYDIIASGRIAPNGLGSGKHGTSSATTKGKYSDANAALDTTNCVNLPGDLPTDYVTRMKSAFTTGKTTTVGASTACATAGIASTNGNAIGYATIDVADACTTGLPSGGATYFSTEARYDNVLVGDYQQINSANNFAQGSPMVHIRAIPEGGEPSSAASATTNLNRTFYSRYLVGAANTRMDRRQPLPSSFAARWIKGGSGGFATTFKIWREGITTEGPNAACSTYPNNNTSVTELVVFDEAENAVALTPNPIIVSPPITPGTVTLPETSVTSVAASPYPQIDAVGGWMYLNLDNSAADGIASQNWVISTMRAEGRYSVDFEAAHLANGCTAATGVSEITSAGSSIEIGPDVAADWNNQAANNTP